MARASGGIPAFERKELAETPWRTSSPGSAWAAEHDAIGVPSRAAEAAPSALFNAATSPGGRAIRPVLNTWTASRQWRPPEWQLTAPRPDVGNSSASSAGTGFAGRQQLRHSSCGESATQVDTRRQAPRPGDPWRRSSAAGARSDRNPGERRAIRRTGWKRIATDQRTTLSRFRFPM